MQVWIVTMALIESFWESKQTNGNSTFSLLLVTHQSVVGCHLSDEPVLLWPCGYQSLSCLHDAGAAGNERDAWSRPSNTIKYVVLEGFGRFSEGFLEGFGRLFGLFSWFVCWGIGDMKTGWLMIRPTWLLHKEDPARSSSKRQMAYPCLFWWLSIAYCGIIYTVYTPCLIWAHLNNYNYISHIQLVF